MPEKPSRPHRPEVAPIYETKPAPVEDEESRLFYERLCQSGQLVEVQGPEDALRLQSDPKVTHVRYPDGTVRRIAIKNAS
jgi:hypothetical protein